MVGYPKQSFRDYRYKAKEIAECLGKDSVAVVGYLRRDQNLRFKWKD